MRVLFVDDNADMCAMMRLILARRGYVVETSATAPAALELAPRFAPDVVISDISMPEMNGHEFMAALRAQCNESFGAIALSGFCSEEDRALSRSVGYDECLAKPVDFDELYRAIDELGARRALEGFRHEVAPHSSSEARTAAYN